MTPVRRGQDVADRTFSSLVTFHHYMCFKCIHSFIKAIDLEQVHNTANNYCTLVH